MALVSLDPKIFQQFLKRRRERGGDRYDEVWNGVYVMSPLADNEHQLVQIELAFAIKEAIRDRTGVRILAGTNVSDRETDWRKNYRCPDLAVFLPGNPAQDCGSHWFGGPDFAVEILSRFDRSRKKFGFYAKVGVRELLFVARSPWRLELYRRQGQEWLTVGTSDPEGTEVVASAVVPVSFRLIPGEPRPRIEVVHQDDGRTWLI